MSTATTPMIPEAPAPLEIPGPVARVPSLDELYNLTDIPDRRVVFRGVEWAFYEELVDSIPEHVRHPRGLRRQGPGDRALRDPACAGQDHARPDCEQDRLRLPDPMELSRLDHLEAPEVGRGLESDESYDFLPETLEQVAVPWQQLSNDVADDPNPDLAIEVDPTRPQVDRAGIYAALGVGEVWRFDGELFIERLTPRGTYEVVDRSGFLPVRTDEVQRLIDERGTGDDMNWGRRLEAELLGKKRHERL